MLRNSTITKAQDISCAFVREKFFSLDF